MVNNGVEIGIQLGGPIDIGIGAAHLTRTGNSAVVHGLIRSTGIGGNNVVNWTVVENSTLRLGIPSHLHTAILLKRSTNEVFRADISIKAEVSGFSFRDIQDGLIDSEDDPVIFNPQAPPQWPDGRLRDDKVHKLETINLSSLFSADVLTPVYLDWDNTQTDDAMERKIAEDFGRSSNLEDSNSVSWFINLWDMTSDVKKGVTLPRTLQEKDLEEYFSWTSESLVGSWSCFMSSSLLTLAE